MEVNYNTQAYNYEKTRNIEPVVYSMLSYMLSVKKGDIILDFGCGTGNYLEKILLDYEVNVYGVEPSFEMRRIAQEKIQQSHILEGNHMYLPFPDICFNKIYCTDVIHHISQPEILFRNLLNIASAGARFCICTESPSQIAEKYWIKYFPSIPNIDSQRFHQIKKLIRLGEMNGWIHKETLKTEQEIIAPIPKRFMERIRQKTLSVLNLISNEEYEQGISLMEIDYQNQIVLCQQEGYTFILFEKEAYEI